MSQQDLHLTTEQLSTWLDQQLTAEEQAYCSAHLGECEQCQDVLDNLQQTVNLLQSLPQIEVPRSFVLPANFKSTEIAQSTSNGNRQQQVDHSTAISPHGLPTPLRRTLRTISALAAIIGLFMALSGFVATLQLGTSAVPMANSTSSSASSQDQQAPQTKSQLTNSNANSSAGPISPPTAQTANKPQAQSMPVQNPPAGAHSTATWPILPFLDFNQSGVRLSIGILLIILGGMGFTLFAQRLKQRNL